MNFIFSLAHFCEIHGPTSILCTQLSPQSCLVCTSNRYDSQTEISSRTTSPDSKRRPLSSDGLLTPASSASPSPTATPPVSPKASITSIPPPHGGPSLLSSATSSSSDTCASCSLTLPRGLSDRLPIKDGKKIPVLRSREAVVAGGSYVEAQPGSRSGSKHRRRQSQHQHNMVSSRDIQYPPTPQRRRSSSSGCSSSNSSTNLYQYNMEHDGSSTSSSSSSSEVDVPLNKRSTAVPVHTHNLTYISARFPSPERFAALRRACVRTLSCESLPTQTGPIFVGDSDAGYTIAYVFRLADPKARGGRRTYALLCLSTEEKKIVSSYGYVTSVFEGLVARIKELASIAASSATGSSPNGSVFKNGASPDGFLRRHPSVSSGKGLAELVGREQLFVEVHASFSALLGGLARRFGCHDDTETQLPVTMYDRLAGSNSLPGGFATGGLTASERDNIGVVRVNESRTRKEKMEMEMTA